MAANSFSTSSSLSQGFVMKSSAPSFSEFTAMLMSPKAVKEQVNTRALTDLDDVSSMDEIPEVDNDLPAGEFEKMAGEISSLESMREEEDQDDDDEDEDDMM